MFRNLLNTFTIVVCLATVVNASMTSTNFQAKDTAIIVGSGRMVSTNFVGRLVVNQPSPLDEIVICYGNSDPDMDVDGKDLAALATTGFTQTELANFSESFGKTNCDKGE